jgi:hypothetical protein
MPAPYGVTPTGFNRPTLQELKAQIEADQLSEISPTLDVSSDALVGQMNGIFARQLDIAWEALETGYHGFDPDAAEDVLLVSLAKLTGTERRAATASIVACTVGLDEGTTLEAGVHFAHVQDKPDVRFTPKENFTAPSDGLHTGVTFVCEHVGPVAAAAGTLTVIATPVVGWSSITNPLDAALGRNVDTDEELRVRREQQLTRGGSSTVSAIRADLLELEAIETVVMFENVSDAFDANGLPPHSFEAVIWDGSPPSVANDAIAQAIWDTKPSGIRSFGFVSGTATDEDGATQVVQFSRATVRNVFVDYTLVTGSGFVLSVFKAAVSLACNELHATGVDVLVARLISLGLQQVGVLDVPSVRVGFSPSPAGTTNLAIGIREIARFDSTRITST